MIAVHRETKNRFDNLQFPDYVKGNDSKLRYIIEKFERMNQQ